MSESPQPAKPEKKSDCTKTPYANLIRYEPSKVYFGRLRVKGKLIRRSLKTTVLTVAKMRLADFEKEERGKVKSQEAVAEGKMTFGDCLEVFKTRMVGNSDMKPKTKEYNHDRIKGLVRSWPELVKMDVSRVTRAQCAEWGIRHATKYSSSSHMECCKLTLSIFTASVCRTDGTQRNAFLKVAGFDRSLTHPQQQLPQGLLGKTPE